MFNPGHLTVTTGRLHALERYRTVGYVGFRVWDVRQSCYSHTMYVLGTEGELFEHNPHHYEAGDDLDRVDPDLFVVEMKIATNFFGEPVYDQDVLLYEGRLYGLKLDLVIPEDDEYLYGFVNIEVTDIESPDCVGHRWP